MEGGGWVELQLLHLPQGIWGVDLWSLVVGWVAPTYLHSGAAQNDGKVRMAEVSHSELATLSDVSRHVHSMAAQVCPGGIFYEPGLWLILQLLPATQ